jgi:chromosome segregation ATPase
MENETRDWETNPHLYLQDDEGNFVLKKDGTPKKKAGRPQTTTEKAIKAARSTVGRKQRNIEKLEQKLNNARQSFKKQKETIQKLDQTLEGPITEDELDTLPKAVKENLNNHKVLFHANEGPQTNFLAAVRKMCYTVELLGVVNHMP